MGVNFLFSQFLQEEEQEVEMFITCFPQPGGDSEHLIITFSPRQVPYEVDGAEQVLSCHLAGFIWRRSVESNWVVQIRIHYLF